MPTEDKVTEIFFMADEFCKFFDRMTKKYTIEAPSKRKYHRDGTLSKAEVIAQVEHSRHRCFDNFFVNAMSAIAAYCCFPKKPAIQVVKYTDNQLTLF